VWDGVQSVEGTFEQLPPILGGFGRAPEYRFDAANAAYREFLGRDDVIGRSAPDLFPEWIGQQVFEAVDRVVASGQSETVSAWGVQAQEPPAEEQDEIYVDMVVTPRRDDSGTVNGVTVHAMPVVDGAGARRAEHRRTLRAERRYEALDYATCGHLPPLVVRPDGHARVLCRRPDPDPSEPGRRRPRSTAFSTWAMSRSSTRTDWSNDPARTCEPGWTRSSP